jgi:hypothetical protein
MRAASVRTTVKEAVAMVVHLTGLNTPVACALRAQDIAHCHQEGVRCERRRQPPDHREV